jgi:hypothetical protein
MRNSESLRDLWSKVFEAQTTYGIATDQAALREVLWINSFVDSVLFRYAVMPCEYDFRFQFGGQVRDRVKILHGHAGGAEAYEAIGKSVNAGWTEGYQVAPRLWSPDVLR